MDVIVMERKCQVRRAADGADFPLLVQFAAPRMVGTDAYEAQATITCELFDRVITSGGVDSVQALTCLLSMVLAFLQSRERQGLSVYLYEVGDIDISDFWAYKP